MHLRRSFILLCLALMLALVPLAQAQDVPPQINLALADLSERLDRDIQLGNLDRWQYTNNLYPNSALGCSLVANPTPFPEGKLAYAFTLVHIGVTYEYRVSNDNTIVFPCDAQLLAVTLVPPPTNVPCPPNYEGLLPPQLLGATQARVAASDTPLRLRVAPTTSADQLTTINPGSTVNILGGPSCADGFIWWRISFNGQSGWAAEGALPDNYFLEVLDVPDVTPLPETPTTAPTAQPVPTLTPIPVNQPTAEPVGRPSPIPLNPPTQQPQQPPADVSGLPELGGVTSGALSLLDLENGQVAGERAVAPVIMVNGPAIDDITFSPDGQTVVYKLRNDDFSLDLYAANTSGGDPVLLDTGLYYGLPASFTPDGLVLYAKRGQGEPNENGEPVNIFEQAPSGGTPTLVATYTFGVGCGGGTSYPAMAVYGWEAGYGGRGFVLEVTPQGLVYTTNCTGSGTALLNLQNGQTVAEWPNLSRVDVSADGTQLVGISETDLTPGNGTLTVVDLATRAESPLGAVAAPDQVAWGPNGDIFYATRIAATATIPGSDADPNIINMLGGGLPIDRVALHRVSLTQRSDAQIFTADAHAIGRIFVAPDNSAVYFSVIPNGDLLWQAIENGSFPGDNTIDISTYFLPALNRMALDSGDVQLIVPQILQATPNEAALAGAQVESVG